jgi:NAD(P)-dependent dehydrogenase (short-subunit alcohol dehydrogenase family)
VKSIVITGSSRGIGYYLAHAFLARGCRIVVSGSNQSSTQTAIETLSSRQPEGNIIGQACNVGEYNQVQTLWDVAKSHYGTIDIWINNAGKAHLQMDFNAISFEEIHSVISTNILGVMYGSRVALNGMLTQGFGALYNMHGLGSSGRHIKGLTLYGASKAYMPYFLTCLVNEVKGTPIIVGALNPGMVITDMVIDQYKENPKGLERAKRIFNIIADRPETVAPWLADQILVNTKNGVQLNWSNNFKTFLRFLKAPLSKRDLFIKNELDS